MSHESRASRRSFEAPSWALSWDADRADDRRGLKIALAGALVIHAALLLVRLAEDEMVLQPVKAVLRPQLRDLVPSKPEPEPAPIPEPVREEPAVSPIRVAVPAELASPEPLPALEPLALQVELRSPPAEVLSFPEAPPPGPEPVPRFRGEMDRPVRVAGVDPVYTEAARRVREQGVVILDAVIDESGAVREIEVVKPLRFGLTEAAVRAVSTWRFEPARLDGRPIAVRYNLTVRFSLR